VQTSSPVTQFPANTNAVAGGPSWLPLKLLKWATALLVVKVTIGILFNYLDYWPPNFNSDFLLGREKHFFTGYRWAFYVHIVSSPALLISGLFLLNQSIRRRYTWVHRLVGRLHVGGILVLLTPSSLWMACYAATGIIAGVGFAVLSIVTAVSACMGWQQAMQGRIAAHQRWMLQTFVLLCSAIVLRLINGLARVLGFEAWWLYPASAWASWVVPLAILYVARLASLKAARIFPNRTPSQH
jgi:uncharacterized membrane protein